MSRLSRLLEGRFVSWNQQNLEGLTACDDLLTPQARETVRLFAQARRGRVFNRLWALWRSRVYRQTVLGQFSLVIACIINKM